MLDSAHQIIAIGDFPVVFRVLRRYGRPPVYRALQLRCSEDVRLGRIVYGTPTPGTIFTSMSALTQVRLIALKYAGSVFFPSQNRINRRLGSSWVLRLFRFGVGRPQLLFRRAKGGDGVGKRHRTVATLQISLLKIVTPARSNLGEREEQCRSIRVLLCEPELIAA